MTWERRFAPVYNSVGLHLGEDAVHSIFVLQLVRKSFRGKDQREEEGTIYLDGESVVRRPEKKTLKYSGGF